MLISCPRGETGRRRGLKPPGLQKHVGSNPTVGTLAGVAQLDRAADF